MFSRKINKKNKIKRLILKLLNVYAIDKFTFNFINPKIDNNSSNYDILNYKSFNLSSGFVNLDRKIKSLDIMFRYSPSNSLWQSTDRWKRIIPNINKETLIKVCLMSLKSSILKFLEKNNIAINLNLISDGSNEDFDSKIKNLLNSEKFKISFFKSKISGNRGSYLECCDLAEKSEDLVFFVEDDYLFELECINEIIFSFSKISSILKYDIFMCPSDYPFYYDSNYKTSLIIGKNYRWRNVGETLLTFLFSRKLFNIFKNEIRLVGEQENSPFERPLHEIYKKNNCYAPVNSLSYHLSRSIPAVSENWLKLWETNYKKI